MDNWTTGGILGDGQLDNWGDTGGWTTGQLGGILGVVNGVNWLGQLVGGGHNWLMVLLRLNWLAYLDRMDTDVL